MSDRQDDEFKASWHDPDEWKWFALKIAPGREFIAERLLADEGFDVFVPLQHRRRSHAFIALPRIRGYVFIGFNGEQIPWLSVLRFAVILGVVAHLGKPITLPAFQVFKLASWSQRPLRVGKFPRKRWRRRKSTTEAVIANGPYAGHVVREIRCIEIERQSEREIAEIFRSVATAEILDYDSAPDERVQVEPPICAPGVPVRNPHLTEARQLCPNAA